MRKLLDMWCLLVVVVIGVLQEVVGLAAGELVVPGQGCGQGVYLVVGGEDPCCAATAVSRVRFSAASARACLLA
jgi:hypothetical protein